MQALLCFLSSAIFVFILYFHKYLLYRFHFNVVRVIYCELFLSLCRCRQATHVCSVSEGAPAAGCPTLVLRYTAQAAREAAMACDFFDSHRKSSSKCVVGKDMDQSAASLQQGWHTVGAYTELAHLQGKIGLPPHLPQKRPTSRCCRCY